MCNNKMINNDIVNKVSDKIKIILKNYFDFIR